MLACAGREVFLKTVIQSIPTHSMSCFKLTKKVCNNLRAIIGKYWWSSSLDRNSIHWVAWNVLTKPKIKGGMGFRELERFNVAMLGKHGWRLITNPNSLCSRVLKARYYPDCGFMQATVPKRSSATWRAVVAGREALEQGLISRIGDGFLTSVWNDRWIPGARTMKPSIQLSNGNDVEAINLVAELIDHDIGSWKIDMVRNNFIAPDADAILNIPLRRAGGEDSCAWSLEKSGVYSIKSAYRALMSRNEQAALDEGTITETSSTEKQMWTILWKLNVMPKVRVFWWRVLRGILPVEATLKHRHISQLSRCKICLAKDEDLMHALITCDHAQRFWVEAQG
jgi:hypothetical protein